VVRHRRHQPTLSGDLLTCLTHPRAECLSSMAVSAWLCYLGNKARREA
jgi:hypothetical protein